MPKRVPGVLATAVLFIALAALAAQQLSVQVQETKLRTRPSYLAPPTVDVGYGMRLTVLEERGPWRRVEAPSGETGWLHESALTDKKLKLQSGDTDVQTMADSKELALAGKGFSAEIEDAYQESNQAVDFTWVDRMAAWKVTPERAAQFLAAGDVHPPEGGTR